MDRKYIKYKTKYFELKQMQGGGKKKHIYTEYIPNIDLLKDHGVGGDYEKWKKKNNITSPYCLSFKKDNKIFNYIGALHTNDENSDTFRFIKKIIKRYKPMLIVIEGIPFHKGINPDINYFQGEGMYSVNLGKKYGAKYIGVEGSEVDIVSELSNKYSREDILGYDFLRTHKYFYKTMGSSKKKFMSVFKKYNIFGDKNFNPVEWFENRFGKKFKYGSFLEYASPYNGPDAVITQKLGYDFSRQRDIMSLTNLYKMISEYDNILYIMGQNHVYSNKDVLIDTFGKYEIISSL